jgi:NADH-quinone oxidoreductase subunit E
MSKNGENESETLISILQHIQEEDGYVPQEKLIETAKRLNIPLIDVYGVVTFYKSFSLKPRGRHLITVCLGTACHVRGGGRVVEEIGRILGIKPGETTEDGEFSLETVRCLGCCAIGPILVIDGRYYGQMTAIKVGSIIRKLSSREIICLTE